MVIFLAGLPGSGKTAIAETVAAATGACHLDLDEFKRAIAPALDPDYLTNLDRGIPLQDAVRARLFRMVAELLIPVARCVRYLIVTEVLHQDSTRKILLDALRESPGGCLLVQVIADDQIVIDRLGLPRARHLLKDPIQMRANFSLIFEEMPERDFVLENNGSLEGASAKLIAFIHAAEQKLGR